MSYCEAAPGHPHHGPYHDEEYGFPLSREDEPFELLVLEISQAGLSWLTAELALRRPMGCRQSSLNEGRVVRDRLEVPVVVPECMSGFDRRGGDQKIRGRYTARAARLALPLRASLLFSGADQLLHRP